MSAATRHGRDRGGSFEGPGFLAELRTVLAFLTGLWGTPTGPSLLFPPANVFLAVIRFTEHFAPLYLLPPTVVTPLACVSSLLATDARRGAVAAAHGRDRVRRLRRSPSQPDSPH